MGLFDFFKNKNKDIEKRDGLKLRVCEDDLIDVGIISHYKEKPFTGQVFTLDDEGNVNQEFEMIDGLKHGHMIHYYSNGQIKQQIPYKKDEIDSEREIIYYHEDGQTQSLTESVPLGMDLEGYEKFTETLREKIRNKKREIADPKENLKQYYKNGQLEGDAEWKDGQQHGVTKRYYENGQIKEESSWKDDQRHGVTRLYYENGQLEEESSWKDGLCEGVYIHFREDGEILEEKIIQAGCDVTNIFMQTMMEDDCKHMIKAGLIQDGSQNFKPGELSKKIYDYCKNNLGDEGDFNTKDNQPTHTQFTKKEQNDLRVYAFVRCLAEMMNADGVVDPNEVEALKIFSQEEKEKLSKPYDTNSKEFEFVWGSPYKSISTNRDNLISVIKTHTDKDLNLFLEKIIVMAISDRDLDNKETEYLVGLYSDIHDVSLEEALEMVEAHLRKLDLIK